MTAGYWHSTYWTTDYWHEDYWQDFGTDPVVPKVTTFTSLLYKYYYPTLMFFLKYC